jgi:tritrans,polycis-undecaprenyl-diphosphate synthase [geranylgeranyl-diphosphate specific]
MIKHLALIMDGNRRWAKKQNLMPWLGHQQGTESVRMVIELCLERAIAIVSLYTFSLENFKRSPQEINYLFNIMVEQSNKVLPDLIKNGIKIRFIGDQQYFPKHLRQTINKLEHATKDLTQLHLNILFCYGGRQEIIAAVQRIAQDSKDGTLNPATITPELFQNYLWNGAAPDPDLIIRTGGIKRLSNFSLYQAAYSELYFIDCLWPDVTKQDLAQALEDFKHRQRNFGQ